MASRSAFEWRRTFALYSISLAAGILVAIPTAIAIALGYDSDILRDATAIIAVAIALIAWHRKESAYRAQDAQQVTSEITVTFTRAGASGRFVFLPPDALTAACIAFVAIGVASSGGAAPATGTPARAQAKTDTFFWLVEDGVPPR